MKKGVFFLVAGLFFLVTSGKAQYSFAIGVRSGGTSGITAKFINSPNLASELIVGFWNDGLSFTGLYGWHPNAFGVEGLHWLIGGGGHVTFYGENLRNISPLSWYADVNTDIEDGTFGIGLDLIVGIEFKLPAIPLAISAGLKPFVEFASNVIWFSPDPGIGVMLAF